MTDLRNVIDPGHYALGYNAGFSAGMIEGRKKGMEESAEVAAARAEYYHQRACETHNSNLACEREYGSEACANLAHRIRSLITTGDAEKGEAT